MKTAKDVAYKLLRKSEKLFKTDMVYLARGGFWLTVLQIVSAFSSFALAVGFAHFLSKDSYGTYKYIMSIGIIIASVSLTGLSTVVTNAAARNQDGTLKYSFSKNLRWSLPMFLIFLCTALYYILHGNHTLGFGLLIVGCATPIISSASLADSFFIGKKDFRRSALSSGCVVMFTYAATLVSAIYGASIVLIILVYMLSNLLAELTVYLYALKSYKLNNSIDADASSYGTHLSVINIVNALVDRLDSVLVFHYLGPVELAIYSFAIAMPEQIKGLAKNVSALALPKFSEGSEDSAFRGIGRKMVVMAIAMGLAISVYVIFAPFVFKIFFPQYESTSIFFSRIYAISLIAIVNILPITYLQSIAAKRELYYFNIISGTFQIGIMALFTIKWALLGLIIGISISRVFRLILSVILMKKAHSKFTKTA